jgi:DNA-binding CsgD family transcriptional regulator
LHLLRPKEIAQEAFSPCRGLILVVDPDSQVHFARDAFAKLFGLSPAECRLAVALLNGLQLEVAAGELRISYETARTTLKRIFQKTGTDRQAELVVLLAKIAIKFQSHV